MKNGKNKRNERQSYFNIKAVVQQTGMNPATIRAWERRYGLPQPRRTSGGHRQYSQKDIDTLTWLNERQEEGLSISHAIELWQSTINQGKDPLISNGAGQTIIEESILPQIEGDQIEELRAAWVTACLAYDRDGALQILSRAFALFNPETVAIDLLQKGLVEVGQGWHEGRVSIQQEHFMTALSMQRLELLVASTPPPTRNETIIVAAAPGDFHTFSPLLLTFLLRRRGWDVVYLGANVPADELESMLERVQPSLIIVSAQMLLTAVAVKELFLIAQANDVPLAYGGRVFNQAPDLRQLMPGYYLGDSLGEAIDWVHTSLRQELPATPSIHLPDGYPEALSQFQRRRALIESHVWGLFVAAEQQTTDLPSVNHSMAGLIEAVLSLGDITLLGNDLKWLQSMIMGYDRKREWFGDYLEAYYQAAKIHLSGPAGLIIDWLAGVVDNLHLLSQ